MKKKLLTILLTLCMVVTMLPGAALAAEFDDVEGHWGQEAIERWADYGVLNGNNGAFRPNDVMTRAEFATMLVNMMGYTKTSTTTFTDLNPNAWYADAMSKLVAAGVMNGVGGGRIDPTGQITREQAAVMLCRAFGIKASGEGSINFQDSGKVSPWAVDAMTALSERGMINGVGNNTLSPDGIVNRATAARLTSNMVAEYVTSDTVLTGEIKGVVIVAKGATVEIKDAVVTAPIVVESASVSLVNTKAEEVKVAGEKAAVTADKDSSVTDVSIGGEAPAVEINGEVKGTVTVEEGATAPEIKGDGVKADQVVNNTDADVTVNGETVAPEAGGAGENTDNTDNSDNGDANISTGPSSSGGGKDKTETDEAEKEEDEVATTSHEHDYESEVKTAATCTTAGVMTYTCKNKEGCTKETYEEEIPATGHTWGTADETTGKITCTVKDCGAEKPTEACTEHQYVVTDVAATCLKAGTKTSICKVCNDKKVETTPKTGHDEEDLEAVPSTCTKKGLTAGKQCKVCGTVTVAQSSAPYADHEFGDAEVEKDADCTAGIKSTQKCANCDTTKTTTSAKKSKHTYDSETGACKNENCTVTCEHENATKAAVDGDCKKGFTKTCPTCKNVTTIDGNADHDYGENGKCTAEGCRQTKPEDEKPEEDPCKDGHTVAAKTATNKGASGHEGTCSVCNKTVTVEHETTHSDAVEATCVDAAKTAGDTCACGYTTVTSTGKAKGHDWTTGAEKSTCKNCTEECTHEGASLDNVGDECDNCGYTVAQA